MHASHTNSVPAEAADPLGDGSAPKPAVLLRADQTALVYRQVHLAMFGLAVNAAVVTYALWDAAPRALLLGWLAGNLVLAGYRLVLAWAYRLARPAPEAAGPWALAYGAGTLLSGVLWGVGAPLFFPLVGLPEQVFLTLVTGGLSAGAVSVYSAFALLPAAYMTPALLPLVPLWYVQGGEHAPLMAGMTLLYLGLLLLISRGMHMTTHRALQLRRENAALVQVLSAEKARTEALNADLRTENAERAQAEQALRESEAKFRGLVEHAVDGILLVVNGRAVYANRAMLAMVGCEEADFLRRPLVDFLPDTALGRDHVERVYAEALRERQAAHYEGQLLCREGRGAGTVIDVIISTAVLELNGQLGSISVIKDISERKQAEAELRQAKERAEEANRLKDQFVSLVAHDLKTPLASLFGMVQLLVDDTEAPPAPHQQELLQTIVRGGESLLRTIDDLLNISRLQTGKLKPNLRFIDGYAVADAAVNLLGHLAREKGIALVNEVPPGTRLYADTELMEKVVQNLVANAIKFCRRGDTITVLVPPEEPATVAVRDTGVGIPTTELRDLFDPERAHSRPGTSGERGTGLGLIFSQDMMRAQGGEIVARSVPGEGSEFHARLPLVQPRVMLVGGNAVLGRMLERQLEGIGAALMHVPGVAEARAALAEEAAHLIIAETALPDDGDRFALLRALSDGSEPARVPVIVVLEHGEGQRSEEAFRYGAADTIVKPLVPDELLARVRRFVR